MTIRAKIDLFGQLDCPTDYYNGISFPTGRIPEEVLIFFRDKSDGSLNLNTLQHHRFVLCICLATEGGVQVDADVFNLQPGEGLLFFPYQPHHYTQFESDEIAWLFITFEMKDAAWLEPLRSTVFSVREGDLELINQMVEKYMSPQREMLIPLLSVLLDRLPDATNTRHTGSELSGLKVQTNKHLSAALKYIHNHLDAPIRVVEVAAASGCSETILQNLFATKLNSSIAAYVRKRRILRACQMLDKSDDSISMISDRCGFSSQYAFSRTFKQLMGCPPRAYRRK